MQRYSRALSCLGVTLLATSAISGGKVTFVAYRPELVEDILAKSEHCEFLAAFGHSTESVQALMKSMRSRILLFTQGKPRFRTRLDWYWAIHLLMFRAL